MSANEKEETKTNNTTDKAVSKDDEIQKYNSFNYWRHDNYDRQHDLPDLSSEEPIKVEIEQFDDFDEDDFNDDDEWGDDDNNNNNNGDGDEDDYEDDYEDDDTDGWGDGIEKQDSIPEAEPLPMEKQISAVVKLSREDIKQHIDKKIKTLSETVELNDEKCLLLLRKHKWNEANIIELYFSNPEATQIDAGICINPLSQEGINKKIDESKVIECGVCLEDDININDTYYLQCGHISTCKSCWIYYLLTSTKTTDCINLTCPTHKCKLIIQSHIYKMFLADKYTDAFKRYLRFCDENFVENSKEFVFCPGKSCDMIYSAEVGIAKEICCSECSYRFCYACKYDSHLPASCDVAEMWLNKCSSEAETISWVLAKCKKCPKCRMPIEKNQGCNHMTCRGVYGCGHEFCWLCRGDWKQHGSSTGGYYKCNIYEKNVKEGKINDEDQKAQDAKSELERYEFHYTRFDSHSKSCAHAIKQKETMDQKMHELAQQFGWRLNEANFLLDASNEVIKCWHVMAWTYPISYYLQVENTKQKDVNLDLFHEHQSKLEFFCDGLQEKLDFDFEKLGDIKIRRAVIEFTRTAKQFRTNIEEAIDTNITI